MRIEFDIEEDKVQFLNENGKIELTRHSKIITEEILDEATRIEIARNSSNNHEITSAIIDEAAHYSRRFPPKKKKPTLTKILQILSAISLVILGSLLNIEKFKDGWYVILFICVLIIALFSTIYYVFIDENG